MRFLPLVGKENVATKTELDRLAQSLRNELRAESALAVARLGLELAERFGELSGKINRLQLDMAKRYGDLSVEMAQRCGIVRR